jgi:phenylacetate-CoA ligase
MEQMPTADEQFAATLARTEMLPRPQLVDYRNGLLRRLASFAFARSPFYRDRLAPLFRGSAEADLSAWGEVPILRKADLQNEIDRINPESPPAEIGELFTITTSGTTADPVQFRGCAIARTAEAVMMHRLYRWHGFDLGAPMASIRSYSAGRNAYPEGTTEARWSFPGPQAAHHLLDLRTSVDNIIRWLAARRPAYLLTFPSLAHDIAQHPRASEVAEIGLKHIVAISEIVTDDTRAAVRAHLGCEIAQIYGCSEVGAIALQSEAEGSLSICDESVLVELLDDSGEPVGPGETGRVVLTGLYNYATPFIRYEIGDFATLAEEPCPRGRGLTRLQRVEGRLRNALVGAGGRRIWQSSIRADDIVARLRARQFQVRQPDRESIEVIYVPDDVAAAPVGERELTEYFAKLVGRPVQVMLTAVNEIPRTPGGKHERIVSNLSA